MEYDIKDKLEWTVIFILEFGRKYGLTMKQAFNYLSRYKGIDFIDRNYGYVHATTDMYIHSRLPQWWTTSRNIVIVMEEHWYETFSWNKQRDTTDYTDSH